MIPGHDENDKKDRGATFDCSPPETIDLQDKYSSNVSIFKAPVTNKIPYNNVGLGAVYDAIKGNSFSERTLKLRSFENPDDAKKFKAFNFDYATFSGTFTQRAAQHLIQRTPFICIDLDHIGGTDAIKKIQTIILGNFTPALMFISPSGDGLKAVFKVNPATGEHLQYFRALQRFFDAEIGLRIDPSGSDICRACFMPHDPDAYFNPDCDVLDGSFIDSFPPIERLPISHSTLEKPQAPASVFTTDDVFANLLKWLNNKETFVNGNRNNYVSKLASACNRYGLAEDETVTRLLNFSEPGFVDFEIRAIIKSVYKHTEWHATTSFNENQPYDYYKHLGEEVKRIETSPVPPTPFLPITGFPFNIQALIKECARVYGTPRDFWAVSFLQAIAIAIGSTYEIKDKYTNGALLWVGIVAPTGIGKSEPMDIALRPIYQADSLAEKSFKEKMAQYDSIMGLTTKERTAQGIDVPEPPVKKSHFVVDFTPESLIEAHQANPRGIAIIRDEIVGWISDFGRNASGGEVQNMLSAWSEKFFKVTRKGNKSATLEKPFIPVFGGVQPGKLHILAKDGRTLDGFIQRFIFAFPDECTKPEYQDETLGDDYVNHYHRYIIILLNLQGERQPIKLSQEAKETYKDFFNQNTALINAESNDYVRSVYQKLEIIVLRLALVLHCSNHVDDGLFEAPIQRKTMNDAIEMTEYFRITAGKVYQYIGITVGETGKLDDRNVAQYLFNKRKTTKTAIAEAIGTSRSQLDRLLEKHGTVVQ